jgi:hypothetical protein
MNSQIRNQRTAINDKKKPFCKVCFDAGKPESEYTSHYTRDKPGLDGKVVCPTLKKLECKYCFKKGHTVSYCKVLADFKNGVVKTPPIEKRETVKQEKKPVNIFAALCEEEDAEEKKEELKAIAKVVCQQNLEIGFPSLSKVAPKAQVVMGYAQMAALPKQIVLAPVKEIFVKKYESKWIEEEDSDEEFYEEEEEEEIVIEKPKMPCYSYNDDDW